MRRSPVRHSLDLLASLVLLAVYPAGVRAQGPAAASPLEAWAPPAPAAQPIGSLPDSLTRHRGTKPILKGALIGSVVGVVFAAYANSLCRMDDSAGPHHCTRAAIAAFAIPVAFGAFIGWLATLPPIPKPASSQ
jgi:hypothetical protein